MQLSLLFLAARRRLWCVCPAFFVYTGFELVKIGVLFVLQHHLRAYFVAYWIGELVDIVLVIAVLYHLYSSLFGPYPGLRALQDALFRWAAAMSILVSVVVAALARGNDADRLMAGLLAFTVATAVVKAGLIAFAMILSSALALRWGHYAFGLLVGMGLYSTIELATAAARLQAGAAASPVFRLITASAYSCALLLWVVFFFGRERQAETLRVIPENDLAAWNRALLEMLTR